MIIGPPGSGKSALAKRVSAITGLTLYHMDQLHFLPGWVEKPNDEWLQLIADIAARDEWIIEGCYSATFPIFGCGARIRSSGSICRSRSAFRAY